MKDKRMKGLIYTCPYCGKQYAPYCRAQKYCSRSCSAKGTDRTASRYVDRRKELCYIKIIAQIPIFEQLRPAVGEIYEAERICPPTSTKFYHIQNIGKYGVIVRNDECVEMEGETRDA